MAQSNKHQGLGNEKHISEEERKISGQTKFPLMVLVSLLKLSKTLFFMLTFSSLFKI